MAKVEQHDISEYYITSEILDIGTGTPTFYFGVPQAGYLTRAIYTSTTAQGTGDATLTFEIETVALSQSLLILNTGGAVGRIHTVDFSQVSGSYASEAENNDLIAAGGVIAVVSDGGGVGTGRITLVIRP